MKGRTASAVHAARRPLAHRTGNARRRCAGSPSTPSGAKGAAPAARARRAPPYLSTREGDAAGAASAAGSATATSASAAREATRRVCGREAACAGAAAAERGRASWRAIAAGCRERATCTGHTFGFCDVEGRLRLRGGLGLFAAACRFRARGEPRTYFRAGRVFGRRYTHSCDQCNNAARYATKTLKNRYRCRHHGFMVVKTLTPTS